MDISRDVVYRGYTINDEDIADSITSGGSVGTGISGCVLDSADISDVDVVQFLEKRSQQDGMDAGIPYLGMRRIRLAGTLYAYSKKALFDELAELRAAFSPVLAQREEPLDYGYRPLYFSVPTDRSADYPTNVIDLQVKAMPRQFAAQFGRDMLGESDTASLAIPWQATLVCKDPSIMALSPVDITYTGQTEKTSGTASAATNLISKASHGLSAGNRVRFTSLTGGNGLTTTTTYWVISAGLTSSAFAVSTTSGGSAVNITGDYSDLSFVKSVTKSGTLSNRGNYICPVNMLFLVSDASGSISVTIGDSAFTITVPASTGARTIRFKGADKVLTVEEDDTEVPRMDLLTFTGTYTWPYIPEGDSSYSVTVHGAVADNSSHWWFYEQYA